MDVELYELDKRTIFDIVFKMVDWEICQSVQIEIMPRNVESGVWVEIKLQSRKGRWFRVEGQRQDIVRERLIAAFQEIKDDFGNPNLPYYQNPPPPPPIKPKQPINTL